MQCDTMQVRSSLQFPGTRTGVRGFAFVEGLRGREGK